jgi:hypothetical protein
MKVYYLEFCYLEPAYIDWTIQVWVYDKAEATILGEILAERFAAIFNGVSDTPPRNFG